MNAWRQELADAPGIHVTTILPQAVGTPIFAHAANYCGRRPRPLPPVLTAEEIAEGIVCCAVDPQGEVTYRHLGRGVELLHSFLPRLYQRVVPPAFSAGNYSAERVLDGPGNVLEPASAHQVEGGWRRQHRRELLHAFLDAGRAGMRSLFTRAG